MITIIKMLSITLVMGLLAACVASKPYVTKHRKNISLVSTNTKSTFLKRVDIFVDIYSVNKKCGKVYEGRVKIDSTKELIGLPVNRYTYLSILFHTNSVLRNEKSAIRSEGFLYIRKGRRYQAQLSYNKSIYNVKLYELQKDKKRKVEFSNRVSCN